MGDAMDGYFKMVDDYVELVETKLREFIHEFAKMEITAEELRTKNAPFFASLGQAPRKGDPFDDYFALVDYYVATAEKVLDWLKKTLVFSKTTLTSQKMTLKTEFLKNIDDLELLRNNADPLIETIINVDNMIGRLSKQQYSVDKIKTYFEGESLSNKFHPFLHQYWSFAVSQVTKWVEGVRLMHKYGLMIDKFNRLIKVTDPKTLPHDKLTQLQQAAKLFKNASQKADYLRAQPFNVKYNEEYDAILLEYNSGLKKATEILLYLQGGVSQAFLILRNTNDIKPRRDPEEYKLLKQVKDKDTGKNDLVYVDLKGKKIDAQTNNFQGVFYDNTPEDDINNAILSEKNYNLLESGGTVIIIAYGQSGTGKTFNLTRLIKHFSKNKNFILEGISAVQFYNDVMLTNGKHRLTAKTDAADPNVPTDPAQRAEYKMGQLKLADKCEEKFNSTKMYDIASLLEKPYLTLKIEPVVTVMPQIPGLDKGIMFNIQSFSNKCFETAVKVNRLATSSPTLNRVFETYKQLVKSDRQDQRMSVINAAYKKFCEKKLYLPLYKFDGHTFYMTAKNVVDNGLFCSHYAVSKYDEFIITEVDLEFLMTPIDKKLKDEIVTTCTDLYPKFKKGAEELIEAYDLFLRYRRIVHALSDKIDVVKLEHGFLQIGNMYFKNQNLYTPSERTISTQTFYLEIADIKLGSFLEKEDYLKYKNFETLQFFKENAYDNKSTYPFVLNFYERQELRMYPHYNHSYLPHLVLRREAADQPFSLRIAHKKDSEFSFIQDPIDRGMLDDLIRKSMNHEKTLSEEYQANYPEGQTVIFNDMNLTKKQKAANMALHVIGVGTHDRHSIQCTFVLRKEGKRTTVSTWDPVPETKFTKFEHYEVKKPFKSFATMSQAHWETTPHAFLAKFEHCIQISATGPDNASNYALFDHSELRYNNYFEDDVARLKGAYTTTFDLAPKPLPAGLSLKEAYDAINAARFTRAMPQNPESSRSQLATTLHLSKEGVKSKLVFIDLAGNEHVDTSKKHIVTSESVYINSTLQFVTDMFLRMKEEYPGWELSGKTYTNIVTRATQSYAPTEDQLIYFEPAAKADDFQKFLHKISTPTEKIKPAIVMVVCAYEYYSSWDPPIPSPEVSKESLEKTFRFITALFHFGNPIAAHQKLTHDTTDQEEYAKAGGRRTKRFRRTTVLRRTKQRYR